MDPEQTFLRVHARLSGMLSQLLTPRIRLALEYLYLAGAVALFCLLVVMHTNFVQQPGCSSEFSGIEFGEAQLVQIKIISGGLWVSKASKFWSTWVGPGARRSKIMFRTWKGDKDFEPQPENAADTAVTTATSGLSDSKATVEGSPYHPLSAKESFKAAVMYLFRKWYFRAVSFWRNIKQLSDNTFQLMFRSNWNDFLLTIKGIQLPSMDHLVQWFERRSKAFEPTYLYGVEKGYFLLSEGAKLRHGVRTINITISARNPCFGNRWQQLLINSLVGYDTILTNSLVNSPGHGYLYNFQTKELYDLSYGHEPPEGPTRFGDYFVTKCGVLLMSLFVFFTTTMSVSFTLRETQSRMLRFTVQLQHHARHQLPTFQLIFVHVIESLVFVPIMIGILFFLFEFYDDQLLAFLVLTLVWLCELFTMISVRTSISMQFFPRFFLLYFLVFHIYFFSYTYGFSYLAFSATAAFMQHLILYFWNRFEVPALQRFIRSRAHLHQQTGVQITSSTIYTSTLHIARVNMRDPGTMNEGLGAAREADALLVPDEANRNQQEGQPIENAELAANNPLHYQDQNPQQPGNAPAGSGSLNPFGSLLLWLLGGGASDGIVSFFSMFRDVRDHGQDYTDPPRNENDQVT
ncbi:membralin-like protein At1g60995 isoform X2 [Oryza brachyantha]|uniref:membralin-like protein At1g60995 isoform X2 n=1 Tax=Oryza brachyantha TaxID=4533 RepID=UPI0007764EE6|nr:membralin-like protein At1g60995 isoform X2 [Oryza brachyantha]